MIINVVHGRVKPEHKTTFLAHMAALAPLVQAEKGCITYQQTVSANDELDLILYEEWEDLADLLAHLDSPHMTAHLDEARPWFDRVEMKTFESNPVSLLPVS